MTLEELLEELRENILRDTSDAVANDPHDYLHSDKSLVRYINDAQTQFAKQTLCLRDETTPAVCHVQLVAGQSEYVLDPRVLSMFGARVNYRQLKRTTYAAMTQRGGDVSFAPFTNAGACNTGGPMMFYTDREDGKVGVYPIPNEQFIESTGGLLILRVARRALEDLVVTNLKAAPEIKAEYHLDMLEWAAWRALRNHDTDIENLAKASAHKKRFNDATAELMRQAKHLLAQDIQFGLNTNWST